MPNSNLAKLCDLCGRIFNIGGYVTHVRACEKKYHRRSKELEKWLYERIIREKSMHNQYYDSHRDPIKQRATFNAYFNNSFSFSESTILAEKNKEEGKYVTTITKSGNTVRKNKKELHKQLG